MKPPHSVQDTVEKYCTGCKYRTPVRYLSFRFCDKADTCLVLAPYSIASPYGRFMSIYGRVVDENATTY